MAKAVEATTAHSALLKLKGVNKASHDRSHTNTPQTHAGRSLPALDHQRIEDGPPQRTVESPPNPSHKRLEHLGWRHHRQIQ